MNLKAVIFDWDGTLFNSGYPIMVAYQETLKANNLPVPPESRLLQAVGRNPDFGFQILVDDLPLDLHDKLCKDYYQQLSEAGSNTELFDGVPEMLEALREKNLRLAVATNMKKVHLEYFLDKFQVGKFFDCYRTADCTAPKPDPKMLEEILEELQLDPQDVMMVGDSDVDITMAKYAGMMSLGVTFDWRNPDAMLSCRPDLRVRTVNQLRKTLVALAD